jgi:iron complex transport system permease protein
MTVVAARRLERPADRTPWIAAAVALCLTVTFFASIAIGALSLSLGEVFGAFGARLGAGELTPAEALNEAVVWDLRLPRVFTAMIVGASLATCGAAMQGLFGNPLADPGIVGVSSGASLGAIAVVVLQISTFGIWTLPVGAFLAGTAATTPSFSWWASPSTPSAAPSPASSPIWRRRNSCRASPSGRWARWRARNGSPSASPRR